MRQIKLENSARPYKALKEFKGEIADFYLKFLPEIRVPFGDLENNKPVSLIPVQNK